MSRLAAALVGCIALSGASAQPAPEALPPGLAGLLTPVPAAGSDTCGQPDPARRDALYSQPRAEGAPVGHLRFGRSRKGGEDCELATPWFEPPSGEAMPLSPAPESSYETAAVVVLEDRGHWYRIAVPGGSAWLLAPPGDFRHDPYPALLVERLAYATDAFDRQLCGRPEVQSCREIQIDPEAPLRVLDIRATSDTAWLQVEFTHAPCDGSADAVLHRGWIRAHGRQGRPAAWFHSRGC
ncbi:hypothetical protein [Arenimonas sp. MALMAid1274]|uniref:hypothetical protein n=1 Tax=Arenimonas sp. MALMAid1274 TaxID=3411630 RepID=UPI003BA39B05